MVPLKLNWKKCREDVIFFSNGTLFQFRFVVFWHWLEINLLYEWIFANSQAFVTFSYLYSDQKIFDLGSKKTVDFL